MSGERKGAIWLCAVVALVAFFMWLMYACEGKGSGVESPSVEVMSPTDSTGVEGRGERGGVSTARDIRKGRDGNGKRNRRTARKKRGTAKTSESDRDILADTITVRYVPCE